jgi:hypothetical protein
MSRNMWLLVGAAVVWYLYNQNQQKNIVGPTLDQVGPGAAQGGTMAPCAPGWYQGTDLTGGLTCLPVASAS